MLARKRGRRSRWLRTRQRNRDRGPGRVGQGGLRLGALMMDAWRCAKRRCARHSASRSAQTSSPTSAVREHFCAVADGDVVGSVSLKPLGPHGLQLRQMAVSEARRGMRIGARLLEVAELWARDQGFFLIVLNAPHGRGGLLRQVRLPKRRRAVRGEHHPSYPHDQAAPLSQAPRGLSRRPLPRAAVMPRPCLCGGRRDRPPQSASHSNENARPLRGCARDGAARSPRWC